MIVGYARVSSAGQSLDIQTQLLTEANCDRVFAEKLSGRSIQGRTALADAIEFVRDGDTLIITRLDRLARSVVDLHKIVERLTAKGCGLKVLQQSGVDTTTSTGKLTLAILAAVAEFETEIRKERQRDGIEKAKAKGVYRGRSPTINPEEVRRLYATGIGATAIARMLSIGRASVYRSLSRGMGH